MMNMCQLYSGKLNVSGEIDLILICHYVAVELTVSKGLDAVVTSSKENRIFRIKN